MSALVTALTLTLAIAGAGLLVVMLRDRPAPAEVVLSGVSLRIQEAGWVQMDHLDPATGAAPSGFQMPSAMMPGAPEHGEERLRVQVELVNRDDAPEVLRGSEFRLENGKGDVWQLRSETIGVDQLNPGLAVSGSLQFDVPTGGIVLGEPGVQLVWERSGKSVRLEVPAGPAPDHGGDH